MALTASNVRVAVTGVVYIAPTGTTAPMSTASATTGFSDLGYVGESGVSESRTLTSTDIKAWQNAATVRTVITDGKVTFGFTLIESSKAVIEAFYGAVTTGATATDGKIAVIPTATGGQKSFLIDVVDGAEKKRIYIAAGEITEVGDIVYASGEPIGYPITITAYPTATLESVTFWSTALKS